MCAYAIIWYGVDLRNYWIRMCDVYVLIELTTFWHE